MRHNHNNSNNTILECIAVTIELQKDFKAKTILQSPVDRNRVGQAIEVNRVDVAIPASFLINHESPF